MAEALRPTPEAPSHRAAELAALLAKLGAERGAVVVVHGRRGVGKGALLSELARAAERRPATLILRGRAVGAGGSSFHAFGEVVRAAMAWIEQQGLAHELIDPRLEDLEPMLRQGAVDGPARPDLDQKLRLFEAVRGLLAAVATRIRLLVAVEDLERADSDTHELAQYLAENLFPDPLLDPQALFPGLLALTVRTDDANHRARELVERLAERRPVEQMHLVGLDLEGLRRYVQSPHVLERLLAASDGLPSEIDELLETLPTNVEELFARRLAALGTAENAVLAALAIYGRAAPAAMVASATSLPVREIARILSALRDARILERQIAHGEIQFGFARRSNLEATLAHASPEERARLHSGWARALTEHSSVGGPALLAFHQLRSSEPARGVPLAIKAAESHAVGGAFDAAARLLEDALPHAKGDLELTILERLSELCSLLGEPLAAARHVAAWKAAVVGPELGRVLAREAELANAAGQHERALESVEAARALLGDGLERAKLEAIATETLYQLHRLTDAAQAAQAGLTRLAALDAPEAKSVEVELVNAMGKIALAADDPARAIERFSATLALAVEHGIGHAEARALVNIGLAHLRADALEDAERNIVAGIERARATNNPRRLAFGVMNLGVLAHRRGELGRAIDCYRECRSLFSRLGNRTQLARVLYNLANLYYLVGDVPRARAHVDEALRLARAGGVERLIAIALVLDGLVLAAEGDLDAAKARLRAAIAEQGHAAGERGAEAMVELAEIELRSGDPVRARETLTELRAEHPAIANRQLAARADLVDARIMAAERRPGARAVLLRARADAEALGERLLLRDLEWALARVSADEGRHVAARTHDEAARGLHAQIAAELPEDLRGAFSVAPSEPRPARAPAPRPASKVPTTRKPEWAARYASIVGDTPKLHKVFHILDRVSQSEDTVLIVGESGTGKELVAEAIHRGSGRAKGPFVKLNCAALVESLLLSELFGHERGSFTGAHQRKAGRFELAAGGTIFLDEIGDISPKTQVALLRVLQEKEFERVGGGRVIKVEARVVCATNRNLAQMVRDGTFREDLYYRLKGLAVELPALRERPEDIVSLAEHFLARYAEESGTVAKRLSPEASATILGYRWPGNVRELENVMRSVALFADGSEIRRRDLDEYRELFEDAPALEAALGESRAETPSLAAPPPPRPIEVAPVAAKNPERVLIDAIFEQGVPLADLKKRIQDEAIAHALRTTQGNITRAADMLGMKRPRLSQIINSSEELKELCQGTGR